ncbi:MAG: ferrous iron transport protein A [Elusimicrobiota bacterium]
MEITLSNAKKGRFKVIKINGGLNLSKKMASLGIYEGTEIEKILSYNHGPVIVKVLNSQVAIGRGMAEKILLKEIR